MKKLKVMTIVGTRPEIIRLSRVICAFDQAFDHVLVHTGQNYDYELNEIFFKELGLKKPDHFLDSVGASPAETIGNVIAKIDPILEREKPDACLILGDTNSCLASIAAKRRKIPIFHMEAGNRCFDLRVPEEINRKIVDHVSDINLPYSDIAREYLLREGLSPDRVIKTGSPLFEVLTHYAPQIEHSDILKTLQIQENNFFLISAHREENVDSDINLKNLSLSVNEIAKKYRQKIIFSAHPRTRKRIEQQKVEFDSLVHIMKPMGFFDYVKLQKTATAVLSDSGTITEESSILNFPALNIREAHERPEGMEEASVIMSGLRPDQVLRCLDMALLQSRGADRSYRLVADYQMPNVSDKVARIILSYTDYVNRVVWQKHLH